MSTTCFTSIGSCRDPGREDDISIGSSKTRSEQEFSLASLRLSAYEKGAIETVHEVFKIV